ncbi:uncharacterized protein VTP21DRAFT_2492 [Calcarisporiella thermophila]|uniref:uncharacterized protein n=1 Tax=Calcarisporiella thermophila TaxID=911321 RepID=UPI003744232F
MEETKQARDDSKSPVERSQNGGATEKLAFPGDVEHVELSEKQIEGRSERLADLYPDYEKKAGPIPWSAFAIIITELCERCAYYGASTLFVSFMLNNLKITSDKATAINRGFSFIAYLTTILGAVLADQWFGKFRVVLFFSIMYVIGLALLTLSADPDFSFDTRFPLFLVAIYLFIGFGTGGIKSNVSVYAAEQVPKDIVNHEKKVIYTQEMTVERIYRYFYWCINIGALFGQLVCPVISHTQGEKGFVYAFLIPTVFFAFGIVAFVSGKSRYINAPQYGSPLGKAFRCIRYAVSHRFKKKAGDESARPEPNIKREHWLDYAKSDVEGELEWNNQYVEDMKRTIKACKVFLFFIIYYVLYYNMFDAFVTIGTHMQRPSWFGPEQMNVVDSLVIVVLMPFFDLWIYPFLRKTFGWKLGPILRCTLGFAVMTLAFIYLTIWQKVLYSTGPYYDFMSIADPHARDQAVNNLPVWVLVVVYALVALSEIFASCTGLELAYRAASEELKSVVMSIFLFMSALSSLIGMILANWTRDPDYLGLFIFETAAVGVTTIVFYVFFRKYDDDYD